jgi:hypothetical protein
MHLKGLASLLLCFAPVCFGQSSASISGAVTDPQGSVIPQAGVVAMNTATGVKSTAVTNGSGFYNIQNLPIGAYTIEVERSGFQKSVHSGITLTTGESLELNVQLAIGSVGQTVSVTSEAPPVETRTADVSQLVESKSVQDLPLGNRRTLNVVQLTGTALFVNYPNNPGASNPSFSLAGGRTLTQMAWIDGGDGQNVRMGTGQIPLDPPVEAVAEVKVLSNNYSAEYGGSAGGVVVETTKSGTNQFHGSAYEYLRNNAMDAPGYFAPVANGSKQVPELRYNVFGVTAGGPIRRNKTFFFFSYEGQRLRTGGTDTLTVPTAAQRGGDFSQALTAKGALIPIYDPSTTTVTNGATVRTPYAGNRIPAAQLDSVGLKMAAFYPLPNQAASNPAGANNFSANYVDKPAANFFMGKVDHSFSDKDKLTVRYMENKGTETVTSVFPDPGADSRAIAPKSQDYTYGSWVHIVNPSQVNDFRFTYSGRSNHAESQGLGGNYPSKMGLKGVPDDAFPRIAPAGYTTMGAGTQERQQYPILQYQWVDNYAWIRGRHAMKFGFEARRGFNQDILKTSVSGSFTFATTPSGLPGNASTGIGLASMLLGFPTAFNELATQPLDRRSWYLAGFAEDVWSATKDLTLTLGIRWETDTPMNDENNRMNSFAPSQINPVSGTPGVVKFAGLNGTPRSPFNTDGNNFGPRLGFAWKVLGSSSTVIRGGYGIFYSHPFDSGVPNVAALGFSTSATLNTPDNGITAPFYLRNGVPVSPVAPVLDDSFGAVKVGTNPNTAVTYFDRNRATGYSQQFNLGAQRQVRGGILIELTGLGNLSRKLPATTMSINQIPPSILGPQHSTQKDRPFPQFSDVQLLLPTLGVSNYYAGLVRVTKRYSKGLSLGASYTYSKYLTNADSPGGTDIGNNGGPYSDFYNRRADYGPSNNDVRHHLALSWLYELPFGTGRRWLSANPVRYLLGGWSLSNVSTFQTGAPFTTTAQTDTTNSFAAGALRPNVLENPNLPSGQRSVAEWFKTAEFAQPAQYHFGNEGVGILRGAGVVDCDFSVLRTIRFKERAQVELRGDFFNAFNHTNLSLPGRTFGSSTFGVISSAGPARQVEIGARLSF